MNKKELVRAIAKETGYTLKDVTTVMDIFEKVVIEGVKTEDVKIMDGVTLCRKYKEATTARNPVTGEKVSVPAKYAPKCKFGKAFKEAVND